MIITGDFTLQIGSVESVTLSGPDCVYHDMRVLVERVATREEYLAYVHACGLDHLVTSPETLGPNYYLVHTD